MHKTIKNIHVDQFQWLLLNYMYDYYLNQETCLCWMSSWVSCIIYRYILYFIIGDEDADLKLSMCLFHHGMTTLLFAYFLIRQSVCGLNKKHAHGHAHSFCLKKKVICFIKRLKLYRICLLNQHKKVVLLIQINLYYN